MRATPILPESMSVRIYGKCRWCACPILKQDGSLNVRRLWHPDCFSAYRLLTHARTIRRAVRKRDKKICAVCKTKCNSTDKPWAADHVVPVFFSEGRLEYFELHNLQTLCVVHHSEKTAKDMDNYHKWKRGKSVVMIAGRVSDLVRIRKELHIVYHEGAEERPEDLALDMQSYKPFLVFHAK
jgi:hypothetical protein